MDVARNPASFCPSLSLEQKWDLLKPEIEELYVEQGFTLRKVVEHMKAQYNFDAKYVASAKFLRHLLLTDLGQRISLQVSYQNMGSEEKCLRYKEEGYERQSLISIAWITYRRRQIQGPCCSRTKTTSSGKDRPPPKPTRFPAPRG